MAQLAPLSRVDLRQALELLFDEQELHTLCFDLCESLGADYDYENLGGEGKRAKARELVSLAERRGHLAVLADTIRRRRPSVDTRFSYQRVQELQGFIMDSSPPQVRDKFVELTYQIDAYLNKFNLLHEQLEEWKEIHHILQQLQNSFARCRSHTYTLNRLEGSARSVREQQDTILYKVDVEWGPCKRCIKLLQQLASDIHVIGEPYDPDSGTGPDWFTVPRHEAAEIDRALHDRDAARLREHLDAFGYQIDLSLYLADKALRDVVRKISRLPRPGSYAVRSQ